MSKTVGVFSFMVDIHGAKVTVDDKPLLAGALSDGEIDAHIQMLVDDLKSLAPKMKRAVRANANKPDF